MCSLPYSKDNNTSLFFGLYYLVECPFCLFRLSKNLSLALIARCGKGLRVNEYFQQFHWISFKIWCRSVYFTYLRWNIRVLLLNHQTLTLWRVPFLSTTISGLITYIVSTSCHYRLSNPFFFRNNNFLEPSMSSKKNQLL